MAKCKFGLLFGVAVIALSFVGCGGVAMDGDEPGSTPDPTIEMDGGSAPPPEVVNPSVPITRSSNAPAVLSPAPDGGAPAIPPAACDAGAATTRIQIVANLSPMNEILPGDWDPESPWTSVSFVTSVGVFDRFGRSHTLNVGFQHTAQSVEAYHVFRADDPTGDLPIPAPELGHGTLTFTEAGRLADVIVEVPVLVRFSNEAGDQVIGMNFGDSLAEGGNGGGSSSTGVVTTVTWQSVDGHAGNCH